MTQDPDPSPVADAAITLDAMPDTEGRALARPQIDKAPYNPARDREAKRGQIAMILVWLLVGVVAGAFLLLVGKAACMGFGGTAMCMAFDIVNVRTVIEMLLTPVVGLVGAVTGFYFGEKN